MEKNFNRTKYTCYYTYVAMSSVFALPALLFMTFNNTYGISYTLLGTLVLINFCTQLGIDLIFTFFTRFFNIKLTIRIMPLLTAVGLTVYGLSPIIFKGREFLGLAIGTVIFSVAAGLCEVLTSPLVAAVPSDNKERDMSMLHSLYAWGVVIVVGITTLFINIFGAENWMYLTFFFALLPIVACVLFCISPMPEVDVSNPVSDKDGKGGRLMGLALCFCCIFFGSAAENVMTNWISSYMETALSISKSICDIFGMALFAILLGFGRVLNAKYGKNIYKVLVVGMCASVICYLTAGLASNVFIALFACIITGFATSMLWPGTLILMEEKIPNPGIAAYALMAAGGDFGASIAPQLMGVLIDKVTISGFGKEMALKLSLSPEQIGMKVGMLTTAIFPILGIIVLIFIKRYFSKKAV